MIKDIGSSQTIRERTTSGKNTESSEDFEHHSPNFYYERVWETKLMIRKTAAFVWQSM